MVIEPQTAHDVASALRQASERKQSVVIRGAGTKSGWGRPPSRIDITLCTRKLNRLIAHERGDLTATVEAGAALREVNDALARAGQWLPLDPPFAERATIGGILATNDSGPLRHRYGAPRDLVIGVQLATTDGVLARAGGQVVKNVAGYDLSKLVAGSFGSLAAIVSATFKLAPVPPATKTLIAVMPDIATAGEAVRNVMASQLEPIAFEVTATNGSAISILLRFASVPAAVEAEIEQARALAALKRCATTIVDGEAESAAWREHAERIWNRDGVIVRASWLPANIMNALAELRDVTASETGSETEIIGRAGVGAGLIRLNVHSVHGGDGAHAQASVVSALRRSASFGNVVIVRGSDELKSMVDVWGTQGDRARIFASLKHALDPNDVLNAGRGPL